MKLVFNVPDIRATELDPAEIAGLVAKQLRDMLETDGVLGQALRIVIGIERSNEAHPIERRLVAARAAWRLTPRQIDVMRLVARGDANKEIAATLGCSEGTIELHVTTIFRRVGVTSRTQLVARFWTWI